MNLQNSSIDVPPHESDDEDHLHPMHIYDNLSAPKNNGAVSACEQLQHVPEPDTEADETEKAPAISSITDISQLKDISNLTMPNYTEKDQKSPEFKKSEKKKEHKQSNKGKNPTQRRSQNLSTHYLKEYKENNQKKEDKKKKVNQELLFRHQPRNESSLTKQTIEERSLSGGRSQWTSQTSNSVISPHLNRKNKQLQEWQEKINKKVKKKEIKREKMREQKTPVTQAKQII